MINLDIISIFQYSFIQRAFVAGIFIALVCSILGLFLVLKRLSLIGDGLSHVSFGAVALGLFFGWLPIYTAVPIVVIASLIILWLVNKTKIYGDAAIGIVSSVGLASGIILASISNGFNIDLLSYLFGNILAISAQEMYFSVILSILVLVIVFLFYHDLFSVSFNEDHAQVTGIKVKLINSILVMLTALTVVLSIRVVGIMLISSFLILPPLISLQFAKSFKSALVISAIVSIVTVVFGILISFILNIPTGATIVIVNFIFLVISLIYKKIFLK